MKKLLKKAPLPLLRPGLRDKQANYWLRNSFQSLMQDNGHAFQNKFYDESTPTLPLRQGHRAMPLYVFQPGLEGPYPIETSTPFALIHVNEINGKMTELPKAVVSAMGTPVKSPLKIEHYHWTMTQGTNTLQDEKTREAVYFNEFFTGPVGSVSFLGDLSDDDLLRDSIVAAADGEQITFLELNLADNTHQLVEIDGSDLENHTGFFLVEIKIRSFDYRDDQWRSTTDKHLILATTSSFSDLTATPESQQLLESMFSSIQNNPMLFFPDEEYQKELVRRAGRLCTYWGGLAEILDFTTVQPDDIPDLDFIEQARRSPTRLTNQELALLDLESKAYDTKEGRILFRIRNTFDTAASKIKELETLADPYLRKVASQEIMVNSLEQALATVTEQLERARARRDGVVAEAELNTKELTNQRRIVDALESKLISAQDAFNTTLDNLREEIKASPDNFEAKLDKLGIIITDALVRHKETKEERPLVGNQDLLGEDEWYLGHIGFITTAPHVISVDALKLGADAPKIVGGPYQVDLSCHYDPSEKKFTSPQMFLRLASVDAVFGKMRRGHTWKAKIHPHTQPSNLRPDMASLERFVSSAHLVCLGEAESVISQGFNNKDIFLVMMAVLSWIKSANTENLDGGAMPDEYGAAWDWFPSPQEVSLDGLWNAKLEEPKPEPEPEISKEDKRWENIQKKLAAAGLPMPKAVKPIETHAAGALATFMRNDDEDNSAEEDDIRMEI